MCVYIIVYIYIYICIYIYDVCVSAYDVFCWTKWCSSASTSISTWSQAGLGLQLAALPLRVAPRSSLNGPTQKNREIPLAFYSQRRILQQSFSISHIWFPKIVVPLTHLSSWHFSRPWILWYPDCYPRFNIAQSSRLILRPGVCSGHPPWARCRPGMSTAWCCFS